MGDASADQQEARARQESSLEKMRTRFDAVADRVQRVYGFRLPRYLAVFAAFWDSLDEAEREALDYVGLSSGGVLQYFEDGGLDLVARDGLDERLESRFRYDPPEFLTVMFGDSDGLHFGLWYDDPAKLPTSLVSSYARDDPTVNACDGVTPLAGIRACLEEDAAELGFDENLDDSELDEDELAHARAISVALAAVQAFADADQQALEADGGAPQVDGELVEVWGCPGLVLPPGSGDPSAGTTPFERHEAYKERSADLWMIAHARDELAAGRPAFALVVGHELRFQDLDEHRAQGWGMLIAAYRALGRHALADIATVHRDNLDIDSVEVLC